MSGQLEFEDEDRSAALRHAWELCLHLLATKLSKVSLETTIRPVQPLEYKRNIVVLGVGNAWHRERIEKNHANAIRSALEFHLDTTGLQVQFVVMSRDQQQALENSSVARKSRSSRHQSEAQPTLPLDNEDDLNEESLFGSSAQGTLGLSLEDGKEANRDKKKGREEKSYSESMTPEIQGAKPKSQNPSARAKSTARSEPAAELPIPSLPLNEKYQLTNYLVGRSNRFAHANAMAVAARPGHAYNPFFLYGGPGLGKTHLMQGIANAIRVAYPRQRIAYVTGEYFAQHYITSVREHATENFRRQYRHIDVWLIDDIQYIAGKEHTKEEFFHTFNTLYQSGKQIIIASDRSPRELNTMDERLRSRFQSGLIADITPPDLETRIAFLQNLRERENAPVPDSVLEYIASAIQSNMRTLEGAITKLVAYSSVMNTPINNDLADDVLGEFFIERRPQARNVNLDSIAKIVANEFGVPDLALKGTSRNKDVALARQVAIYLCREYMPEISTRVVGMTFGGRDHTTVIRSCQKIQEIMGIDVELKETITRIVKQITR